LEEDRIRLIFFDTPSLPIISTRKRWTQRKTQTRLAITRHRQRALRITAPGWRASAPKKINPKQEEEWKQASHGQGKRKGGMGDGQLSTGSVVNPIVTNDNSVLL
jgi:hypothetical protein